MMRVRRALCRMLLPGLGQTDDLTECMTNRVQQVEDVMTIGELRLQCQKQLHSGEYVAEAKPDTVVSQRLHKDKEHVLEPYSLMAHKPNYIFVAARTISVAMPRLFVASRPETRI